MTLSIIVYCKSSFRNFGIGIEIRTALRSMSFNSIVKIFVALAVSVFLIADQEKET